jgi:hypothetical protein
MHNKYTPRFFPAIVAFTILFSALTSASSAQAALFNPHYLISDTEIRDAGSMSLNEITAFLNSHGKLNTYFDIDPIDNLLKNPSQLIFDAAQRYTINPKYIMVLLQKESGIVEGTPTQKLLDWATGYALCDRCQRTAPLAQKYKGLAKQIDAGAGWMDWFLKNSANQKSLYKAGVTYSINNTPITPTNAATAALYSYTPHISGNRLFWRIWQRWFNDDSAATQMPDGAILRNAKTNEYSVVQAGVFRPIKYKSLVGTRFSASAVISLEDSEYTLLTKASPGKTIAFADLALVKTETGDIYLLVGNTRRHITSPEAFQTIGFNPEELEDVLFSDIADYIPGQDITTTTGPIIPRLVQDISTGGVFYIEDNIKHPLWDKALLITNFPDKRLTKATTTELSKYTLGSPISFLNGTLVKSASDPTVYLISNGQRRPITSEQVFLDFGFSWTAIITTTQKMLDLHELGAPLDISEKPAEETNPIQTAGL